MKKPNHLIHETSPYLLQHAYNPVNWRAWNDETLKLAKDQNKLLLISIGYSSCHWCHVMEHESFESQAVADVMNANFICVKVDREERPDIDQVYMTAVQLITGSGGWPLNCIATPDGRPIWGGTYFKKEQWINALNQVADLFVNDPERVEEYAESLMEGIQKSEELLPLEEEKMLSSDILDEMYVNWSRGFDKKEGGNDRAPKFPMPNNYEFLLDYGLLTNTQDAMNHVELTLNKMAQGGIYDQIGGGFARYSTDLLWKAPHFEKMLYDNAQLVGLYSKAFRVFKNPEYKKVICQSLEFVSREMTGPDGEFYSALDADTEGEEGRYYVWQKEELQKVIPENDWSLFKDYYNVNSNGHWEDAYILLRRMSNVAFSEKNEISVKDLEIKVNRWNEILLKERQQREAPGLDNKSLTSWNALMINGYLEAYLAIGDENFLKAALKNANFIKSKQLQNNGSLWHSYKQNTSSIQGFLEDYAHTIWAFIKLYEVTGEVEWFNYAEGLLAYTKTHFKDSKSGLYFFTSNLSESLIARTIEKEDNVIPSSNAVMARNMFYIAHYKGDLNLADEALKMTVYIQDNIYKYGPAYSNWGLLILHEIKPFYEVAITGSNAKARYFEMQESNYIPNVVYAYAEEPNQIALLQNRWVKDKTLIYVCQDQSCKLPVSNSAEAINLLK